MIVPSAKFRPNPSRALYIDAIFDAQLVTQLTPQILQLQYQSREPITLYIIESPGGSTSSMEEILRLIKISDQDGSDPCHLITVVTKRAASAAADLLSSGDYAIAYPESRILYHGVRTALPGSPTAEIASLLADYLRLSNDLYAKDLARKIEYRFLFQFVLLRPQFQVVRQNNPSKQMSDLDCFLNLLLGKLSSQAQTVLKRAEERYYRYETLLETVIKKTKKLKGPKRPAEIEAKFLNAIVEFELNKNKKNPNWTFRNAGLGRIGDDFFLLNEYIESQRNERFRVWCKSVGRFALSNEENAEINSLPDKQVKEQKLIEKVQPILQPVFSFFIALCHALQEDENELTALDAYYLGVVDEVMGQSLHTTRHLEERQPDAPVKQGKDEETKTAAEKADTAGA